MCVYHIATVAQVAQVEARVATSDEQGAYDVRFADGTRAASLTALQLRAIDITVNPTAAGATAVDAAAAAAAAAAGAGAAGSDASSGYEDSVSDVSGDVSGDTSLGKAQAAARKVRMKKFRYLKFFEHFFSCKSSFSKCITRSCCAESHSS